MIIGESPAWVRTMAVVRRVAPLPISVLIQGETGTGKELVAKELHRLSGRRGELVSVNCAALPEALVEGLLFGSEKGAYTGAGVGRLGLFHRAAGGTLFLDEVGELALLVQAKLLRALQEGLVRRVGALDEEPVNVRVIAATNQPLDEWIRSGRFRRDLWERLAQYELRLPPLRERGRDIELLTLACLKQLPLQSKPTLDPTGLAVFNRYLWPGNLRELQRTLLRMAVDQVDAITADVAELYLGMSDDLPKRILAELVKPIPRATLEQRLGASKQTVLRALDELVEAGQVVRVGAGRGLQYRRR